MDAPGTRHHGVSRPGPDRPRRRLLRCARAPLLLSASSGFTRASSAFTLVELLIVILIVGVLAAVAIPQFGDTATDAKERALEDNLIRVRKAIQRYYVEHDSTYPGRTVATHKIGNPMIVEAHLDTGIAFQRQLTMYSDAGGHTSDKKDSQYCYGPYLTRGIPANPLPAEKAVGAESSIKVTNETGRLQPDATPDTGWKASCQTGEFIANHPVYYVK